MLTKNTKLKNNEFKISEKKVFENTFRTYYPMMRNYAYFYLRDTNSADDAVMDVFSLLWSKRDHLTINTSVKSYLIRCVHNRCIEKIRQASRNTTPFQVFLQDESSLLKEVVYESGLSNLIVKDVKNIMERTINSMSDKTRKIFCLSRYNYMTNAQIAEKYGVTEKAIEYHITSALKSLRKSLKEYL